MVVNTARQREAILHLLGRRADPAAADRFLAHTAETGVRLDMMWCRLDADNTITATVLIVPNPGRTAVVFASAARGEEDLATIAATVDHATRASAAHDIRLAQVLLDPGLGLSRRLFEMAGFTVLADISYLERPLSRSVPPPTAPPEVTFTTYDESRRAEVLAILTASYVDTLDCPGLRGLRTTEDIFTGHRGSGVFEPDLWTILEVDGVARGIIMLNPSPLNSTIELVYLGLDHTVRGRGFGRLLLDEGIARLNERRERAVSLAVDDLNTPALHLYRSTGFRRVLRRQAMIRPLVDQENSRAGEQ